MADERIYLVAAEPHRFVVDFDGTECTVTDTPSTAKAFIYKDADAYTRRLHARGFRQAYVAALTGEVMTYERLHAIRAEAAVAEKNPPLPQSWEDLYKIPGTECVQREKKQPGFKEAVEQILKTPRPAPKPRRA